MTDDCGLHHIALCRPGQDEPAKWHLSQRGYCVTQPTMVVIRRTARRAVEPVWVPLIAGYLFVRPSPKHGWERLRTAPGMRYGDAALLKVNNQLAFIRDDDPDWITLLETSRRLHDIPTVDTGPKFTPGQRVRVTSGPWVEFCGNIEKLDNEERIVCLLEMLGRKVRAFVKHEHLSLA